MLNIGIVIAASVLVIYIILGPIVILGIYVFFDRMAENALRDGETGPRKNPLPEDKDPSLWSERDVYRYLEKQQHIREKDRIENPERL